MPLRALPGSPFVRRAGAAPVRRRAQRQFAGSAPSRRPGLADRSPGGRSAPAVLPAFRCIARESARESGLYSRGCCCVFVRRGCFIGGTATVVAQRRLKWSRLKWSGLRWQRQRNVDRVASAAAARIAARTNVSPDERGGGNAASSEVARRIRAPAVITLVELPGSPFVLRAGAAPVRRKRALA